MIYLERNVRFLTCVAKMSSQNQIYIFIYMAEGSLLKSDVE